MEIVTLGYNRPDFLELQLNSLKKYVEDFNFTVFNNAPDDSIKDECGRLGITCIPIKIFGGDPSWVVGLALNKMWERLQHEIGIVTYIDHDMFLINELPDMKDYDIAFIPQIRPNVLYPWTGLLMFNMDTLPNPEQMRWQVDYSVKGADVGGLNHYYLKDNKPNVLELEMWTLVDEGKYSFNGADTEIHHENYDKMKELVKDFPRPYSVDMFKVKDEPFDKCFVFHYKSASGYPPFYTPDYNKLKTEALKDLWKKN